MGTRKDHKRRPRSSSFTPKTTHTDADNINLMMTDPWAHQARKSRETLSHDPDSAISKPTALSPVFSGGGSLRRLSATTIGVPQDAKQNPDWIHRQLIAHRNNANRRPEFFSTIIPDEQDESADDTPTPGQKEAREKKRKKKSRQGKEARKQFDEAEEAKRLEKKEKTRVEMKQQVARAVEIQAAANSESRKRKRETDETELFTRRIQMEARAVKSLRDTLPPILLDRVAGVLEKAEGTRPNEMTVLLTAARDTVLDLARAQILQNGRKPDLLQTEMLVVLKSQEARLKQLGVTTEVGIPIALNTLPAATGPSRTSAEALDDNTSSSSSDDGDSDDLVEVAPTRKPRVSQKKVGKSQPPASLDRCLPQ